MDYYNLTTPQKNIWNLQKYYGDTAIGNQCGAIFYKEKRDSNLLKQALYQFIHNQSGMCLRFLEKEEPVQYISDELEEIPVMTFETMDEFESYAEIMVKQPIGLNNTAMYRFVVFQVENRSGILVALSHLISDAWTFGIMANQVDAAYHNLAEGTDNELIKADYTEYIQAEKDYLTSDRYMKDKLYWEDKYDAQPEKGIIRIASAKSDSIEAGRITKCLSADIEYKLNTYCSTQSVTPAVLFETALIIYLSRINSENNSITIGIPVLNRSNVKEKKIAGMFVSTMPLTVEVREDMIVTELAQQISKAHMDIFRHQKYPYADILKSLREKQNFSGNLYDVMISYQNAKTDTGAATKWYSNGYSEVPFVLHIDNRDDNNSHTLNVDYQTAVFKDEREVEYILRRLEYILSQIVDKTEKSMKEISIVPQTEIEEIIEKFNDTYIEYPREKCVHELFTQQVQKTPDKVALVFEDKEFTYKQLDEMSNSLAHYLRERGIKRNEVVPIIAKRSWHVIVAMLGIMKAGGAYMPVDPNYPNDRIEYMLRETNSKLILSYGYVGKFCNINSIELEKFSFKNSVSELAGVNQIEDACYVLFTSGSTGKPKAVIISHSNLGNFVNNNNNKYQCAMVNNCKSVLADTAFTFDISVFEIYLTLLNGLTVILSKDAANASYLAKMINKYDVDVFHCTPTKILMLLQNSEFQKAFANIRMVMIGAENFSEELYKTVSTYTDAVIYNGYGPTETTIGCSFKRVNSVNNRLSKLNIIDDITIGSPIANAQIYILDKNNNPLPIGVAGELCIAGEGVGKGYLNHPELTAEKFVPNPFATAENHHGKTMYHTGDLACWRADGEIEYLGRMDTQVKIRGLRIELGEIENVMSSFTGIQLTAVADKRDGNNRQYLVGYYTSEQEIDEKELRNHLSSKLPKYMVPNYFMRLDVMPITTGGKTDRKNLPIPDFTMQEREYVVPESSTEKKLANIWQKYLQLDEIGKTDDFFECGGDSLIAISMISEIENEFNVEISIKDIMENSILENFAKCIESADSIVRIKNNNRNTYKLLPQQKAIYAVYSRESQSLVYNMPATIKIPKQADINKLKDSIIKSIRHHKILFSHIESDGQELIGVYDNDVELVFEQYDKKDINKFVRPFNLSKAPLVRVGVTENEILFDMHHIVADGETLNIILKGILEEYEGRNVCDEPLTYADYADFFYHQDMTVHKDYFIEQLKCDFESVMLPVTKKPVGKGCSKVYQISESTMSIAKNYARKHNMTDTMVFWGAYGILLSKYSGNSNVLSSIVLKNRIYADTKDMAGMFVNTLPVHMNISGSVSEYMQRTKQQLLGLFEHQELPFALIADTVGMKDKSAVNTSFVYQADGDKSFTVGEEIIVPEPIFTNTSKFELMMEVTPVKAGLKVRMEFDGVKYDEMLMNRLVAAYERILEQLDKEDVSEIEVMSPDEHHKVIEEFNDTYIEYPKEKCVHELFTEQAQKTPDKVALVFEDKEFTYKQLDEMSNSLAHYLRERGIKRNEVVPIIAKRSWHVIVAMLGIMKAGGAYMPVSPEFPLERIKYMFETADVRIALTYDYTIVADNTYFNDRGIQLISLDNIDYFANGFEIQNQNKPDDLCYIIFTSGSTGQPKGVTISHMNTSNYCNNNNNDVCHKIISSGNTRIVSVTNIVFDIFVTESLLPLLNGMTIYLANDAETTSQDKLSRLIIENNIDVLQTTPTKMRSYLMDKNKLEYLSVLKTVVLGGEALPEELVCDIKQHTNARIFNIYGPAETTVWSSNKEVKNARILVHELFERQASIYPERLALVAGKVHLTYSELNKKSDALAKKLIKLGILKGNVIGAYLDRTAYTVISQLAVLKAGGVFLPIDHRYPKDRIDYMLNDCDVKLVLTDKELSNEWNVNYFNLNDYPFDDTWTETVKVRLDDACYIIYTSGSTGKPKGCVLMHKGLANFCANNNIIPYAKTLQHQTVVSVNTISFDFFIAETLLPLSHGWTVVIASEEESNSKELFQKLIEDNKVNIIETTPTRLELYTKNEEGKNSYFQKIQLVVSSGEALPEVLLQQIRNISRAKVFNPLGPSECSVWNVGGDFKTDITIGSPIANTQIYILDKNNKPLPIGVPGELCIAGEGVGKGYLNRPELTAEKFVPNPFATAENHHGKTMYHTGDLACWRADGEIEYLGRIDTQVKIRGLRIELGEIENVMSSFDNMELTAVTDKRDENNRQYLVGYYTSKTEIDEKELRSYLSSKLPKYMVPNYFMRLDTMPMTASGKTDRKNLPIPDFTMQEREYVAPETEIEINLCKLLGDILHIEKVGVEDDFFEYGGDSLTAIEYVAKAHGMGIELSLQNVFDYPTVRTLCNFLQGGKKEKVQYKESDFDKYKDIFDRNIIREEVTLEKKSLGNILLTGATGFLGAHVLNELMQKETGKIYCLVRSSKADDRRGRLGEILKYYFGDRYESEINKRIIPIVGDIEKEGLSDEMPVDVQTVIHTAASVKHYGSYSYFHRVNAQGTAHVVEYAKKTGAKLVHISTLSVSGNSMADDFTVYRSDEEKFFYETSFYIGQPLDNVYIHSKFEAERKVYDAMLEGLDAKVIRVGNLTNSVSDYKFQPNYTSNAFLTRVKAILEFGLFPDYLMSLYAEFSPIDKTAEGIVKIAQYADKQCVFHLNSNKVIYFERFLEVVHKLGISMKVVNGAEFNRALQETIKKSNTEYIFEAFQNDMDAQGRLVYDSNIRIENDFTLWFLKKVGFEWNETDMEYISGYINYFRKIGYLEV